jgi:hypothetical protein
MNHICLVCGYAGLAEPPYINGQPSYEICPCCGFEFGFDDGSKGMSIEVYRNEWLERGAPWFQEKRRPINWDLQRQLSAIPK